MPKKCIYFFKIGSFSHINDNVENILNKHFPDCEIQTVDLWELMRNKLNIFFINMFYILKEYGFDIIRGKKKIHECIFITTYIFRKVKETAEKMVNKNETLFTFQTQSLFDASTKGIPHFLYTDHTFLVNMTYSDFNTGQLPGKKWLSLEKSMYENAWLSFTMSNHITRSIINDYDIDQSKVKCIWAGSNIKPNKLMEEERDYSAKKVLFVGRRWNRKGGPELLKAFENVLLVHPDAELIIVGNKPNIDRNLKNVEVLGNIPLDEVAKYYSLASIFCLPTKIEPFGIVFVEAMMYSLPVVATNVGAVPDFIKNGENGLLVEPGSIEQLSEALIKLLSNSETCRSFGRSGYGIYIERYSWDKVGQRLSENMNIMLNKVNYKQNKIALKKNRAI